MYKKIETFANEIGLSSEDFTDHLIDLKILNKRGYPKKIYINQEVFDEDGHIKHRKDFEQLVSEKQDEMLGSF